MPLDERIFTTSKALYQLKHFAHGFTIPPKSPIKNLYSGQWRSRFKGRGLDFQELRHYHLGDDIRAMDWKVTHRTGKPHIRVYNEEKDRRVLFIVDQRRTMFFGSQYKMKSVIAAEIASLGAWQALHQDNRVGFSILSKDGLTHTPCKRGAKSLQKNLKQLATINQNITTRRSENEINLSQALAKLRGQQQQLGQDTLIVLISDMHDWSKTCEHSLAYLRMKHECIVARVSDPLESDVSQVSSLVVTDGQHQLQINQNKPSLIQAYKSSQSEKLSQLVTSLNKHQTPLIEFNTHEDAHTQLIRQLGRKK